MAAQCLTARPPSRNAVSVLCKSTPGGMENQRSWDGHKDIRGQSRAVCRCETDQPVAALLTDLEHGGDCSKIRWSSGAVSSGALPVAQKGAKTRGGTTTRTASPPGWRAAGFKGGVSHGESDDLGHKAAVDKVHINDLHATILHLLGLEHEKLTYVYNGRRFRLTDVAGEVITPSLRDEEAHHVSAMKTIAVTMATPPAWDRRSASTSSPTRISTAAHSRSSTATYRCSTLSRKPPDSLTLIPNPSGI